MTLDIALAYAASGWAVFPIVAREKRPACEHGLKDATTDPEAIRRLWRGNADLNVGIRTGEASGVFVVDVDGDVGRASLASLPALPPTLTCVTTQGHHYYFGMPPGADLRNSTSKLGDKIDIRANDGYVVAPTSVHPSGHVYRWVDPSAPVAAAPQWLIHRLLADRPRPAATSERFELYAGEGFTLDLVEEMLAAVPPDLPYQDWLNVGMALHHGGFGLGVWDQWSRRGEKYEVGCCFKRWTGFKASGTVTMGTLVHMAQQWGWKPHRIERHHDDDPDILRIREGWALRKKQVAAACPSPAPVAVIAESSPPPTSPRSLLDFDPTDLPGLIGDTVRWIVGSAVKPQPELALLNAIAALGAVFGRRYVSPLKTCTNLYVVGVAGTGSGKDSSRKQIKRLMLEADLMQFVGADGVRSGVGVMKSLLKKPSQVMHLDEFGMLIQAVADIKGAHYMRAFGKNLLELYSSASSTYDIGSVADAKADDIVIYQPALSIYGTTTLETYAPALNRTAIASGALNRFIVLPAANNRPERRRHVVDHDPPAPLVERWKALAEKIPLWSGAIAAKTETVDWPGCEDRIFELGLYEDAQHDAAPHGTGALWGRYREHVIKVAMIRALSERRTDISHLDLDFAEAIVGPSVRYMQQLSIEHMSDSEHEANCQEVLRHVRTAGGEIKRSDLARLCRRLDSKQMTAILDSLIEQGAVEVVKVHHEGAGAPPRMVRILA